MDKLISVINAVNNEFHFGLNKFQIELLAIRIKGMDNQNYKLPQEKQNKTFKVNLKKETYEIKEVNDKVNKEAK